MTISTENPVYADSDIEESEWLVSPSLGVIETKDTELARISDFSLQATQTNPEIVTSTEGE